MKPKIRFYVDDSGKLGLSVSEISTLLWDFRRVQEKINQARHAFEQPAGIPMGVIYDILDINDWIPKSVRNVSYTLYYAPDSDIEVFSDCFFIRNIKKSSKRYIPRLSETPRKVIFHDPATIVYWKDGTKTVVKCGEGDTYSKETGLALCYMKKILGNKGNYNDIFREWIKEEEHERNE